MSAATSQLQQGHDQRSKPPSPELAYSTAFEHDSNIASDGSILHKWNGSIWAPMPPDEMEREAFRWLGAHPVYYSKANVKLAAGCAAAAIINSRKLPQQSQGTEIVLPVRNGYLHVDTLTGNVRLAAPEKRYGLTYLIECDYKSSEDAPTFGSFLTEVLQDEETRLYVQEYAGYTLMPDTRYQRAMFWLGSGANGKSTLAEIIAALHARTTAMTLDDLDGFKLVSLVGSSLVYVDETPQRIDEQRLKALISGGLLQIDRKFREPVTLRPTAKWLICGNQLPAIRDASHGFWRRLPVVTFDRQFGEDEQDPLLARRIVQHELAGVLNWAVAGLVRLVQRGRFPGLPAAMRAAVEAGQRETNSVLAWWDYKQMMAAIGGRQSNGGKL